MPRTALLLPAAALALLMPVSTYAQEASPVASPGASACTVEPRDPAELAALWFGPEGTPLATPLPPEAMTSRMLPTGQAADPATTAAIDATLRQLVACLDGGQYARGFALMTDNVVRQFGPDLNDPTEDTPEEVIALLQSQLAGTPTPGESNGGMAAVTGLREARVLDDGRAGAVWEVEGEEVFVLFRQTDGQWLVDDFVEIGSPTGTPETGATPSS